MPIITLEVMSDSSNTEHSILANETQSNHAIENRLQNASAGMHFLTEKCNDDSSKCESDYIQNYNTEQESSGEVHKARNDLLEYVTRNDGSVVCKICGEILQSRTHWYRHKYKVHVIHPLNPAPLYQCEQCLVFFKSRKGYIGHLASRHNEMLMDSSPIVTNVQVENVVKGKSPTQVHTSQDFKQEPDPELSIPKSSVPNYQTNPAKHTPTKSAEIKKPHKSHKDQANKVDWEEKRSREEKLVADIIDRVRKECEAQGTGGPTRRGYTRRTTVMHT